MITVEIAEVAPVAAISEAAPAIAASTGA